MTSEPSSTQRGLGSAQPPMPSAAEELHSPQRALMHLLNGTLRIVPEPGGGSGVVGGWGMSGGGGGGGGCMRDTLLSSAANLNERRPTRFNARWWQPITRTSSRTQMGPTRVGAQSHTGAPADRRVRRLCCRTGPLEVSVRVHTGRRAAGHHFGAVHANTSSTETTRVFK